MIGVRAALIALGALVLSIPAAAQPRGRFVVSGGLEWMGSASFGSANANEVTPSGGSSQLFATSSDLTASAGFGARIGIRLSRLFEVEGVGTYIRPSIDTRVSGDVEGAPALTVSERLRQFTVEGGVLYIPARWQQGGIVPFLSASAGYLRQIHEGDTLATGGQIYTVGGGARVPLVTRRKGAMKSFGLRGDVRAAIRTKAAAPDGTTHTSPAVGVSAFAVF